MYSKENEEPTKGETDFALPVTVTLGIQWDGQEMHFYANGTEAMDAVPFSGFTDTFGLYWVTTESSSIVCSAEEFRVAWE